MNTNFIPKFELTKRLACKASIMIEGLTGKGKSGLALMLAYGLAGGFKNALTPDQQIETWKKIFATDTENKSLNLFEGLIGSWGGKVYPFYSFQLSEDVGYRPSNYLALRKSAIEHKADVFIADSITHMWNATGGLLDMVNKYKLDHPKDTDNYRVWGQPDISAEKNAIVSVIRHKDIHCITTVRVKEKFEMQYDEERKRNTIVSLGEQQIQQADLKYEPDLVLHMLRAGNQDGTNPKALVTKSRYAPLKEGEEYEFTAQLCEQLRIYLEEGVDPETILEMQRQDYVQATTEYLNTHPNAKPIWDVLKADANVADVKLSDIPLDILKTLYMKLVV